MYKKPLGTGQGLFLEKGCSTNTIVIDVLNNTFPQLCLRRRQAQALIYNAKSHTRDFDAQAYDILNTEVFF